MSTDSRADGATALLWAAHWDNREIVELLLRAGADVNAADDHGVTPLARACENASAAVVDDFVEGGRESERRPDERADAADDCREDRQRRGREDAAGPRRRRECTDRQLGRDGIDVGRRGTASRRRAGC